MHFATIAYNTFQTLVFLLLILNIFLTFSRVDFGQVNVSWVYSAKRYFLTFKGTYCIIDL